MKRRLVRCVKVGQSIQVGEARILVQQKDGQQVKIVVEADEALLIQWPEPRIPDPAPAGSR